MQVNTSWVKNFTKINSLYKIRSTDEKVLIVYEKDNIYVKI